MSQLPFKTAPRQATQIVGNPEIGELEFPVYGSLLWHEREALRKADDGFSLFRESAIVAAPIAQAEAISHIDAHAIVTRILGASLGTGTLLESNELEIRAKYSDTLSQLNDRVVAWNDRRQVAGVTALIANRLEGCSDWTEQDTRSRITESLMAALYNFLSQEEAGQVQAKPDDEQQQELAQELGKSSPAHGSPNQNPTGQRSTGDSDASTQPLQSSDQTALALTPSASSSEPLKRERSKSGSGSTATSSPSPS